MTQTTTATPVRSDAYTFVRMDGEGDDALAVFRSAGIHSPIETALESLVAAIKAETAAHQDDLDHADHVNMQVMGFEDELGAEAVNALANLIHAKFNIEG